MEERETRYRVDTLLARLMDNIPVLARPADTLAPSQNHEAGAQAPAEATPTPKSFTPGIERLLGTHSPPRTIEELGFSSFDKYLAAFEKALDAQVQAGYMLEVDAQVLLKRAGLFPPATFTENYFARYDEFRSGEYCP